MPTCTARPSTHATMLMAGKQNCERAGGQGGATCIDSAPGWVASSHTMHINQHVARSAAPRQLSTSAEDTACIHTAAQAKQRLTCSTMARMAKALDTLPAASSTIIHLRQRAVQQAVGCAVGLSSAHNRTAQRLAAAACYDALQAMLAMQPRPPNRVGRALTRACLMRWAGCCWPTCLQCQLW